MSTPSTFRTDQYTDAHKEEENCPQLIYMSISWHYFTFNTRELCIILLYKMKTQPSCEIEDFVETHLCKLCVILSIARITGCVSSLSIEVGDSPYNCSVSIRVNRVILVSLYTEPKKPVSEGGKI